MISDVTYVGSLLICISLGSYYKKIQDAEMKRQYGAGLGLLTACLICGHQIYHAVAMTWFNVILIKCCDKRYVHQLSMCFTWTYLLYLYFNLVTTQYVLWLHQTLALRLVGLAFEVNNYDKKTNTKQLSTSTAKLGGDNEVIVAEPTAVDIITYAFFFIGIHKGPYYRWKTFNAHFTEPFANLGDCRVITLQKLKKAAVCALGYMLLSLRYSAKIYGDDSFYRNHGTDYRFLYNIPILFMFFLQTQAVLALCTAVCTETGFGVYPAKCNPLPGNGPSEHPSLMNLAAESPELALAEEYNFGMLKCFENEKLLFGPRMKDTLRSWDMPTVYWFWFYVYKNLSKSNKEIRSACAYFAWTVWNGPDLQHFILSATLWVYVNLESEYSGLFGRTAQTGQSGQLKLPWEIGMSIMRVLCIIYLVPCLVVKDTGTVLRYYNSIMWMFHWLLLGSVFSALALHKIVRPDQPVR